MHQVDKIRKNLTEFEVEVLTYIWDYYFENNEYVPIVVLHHEYQKHIVRPVLEKLGGCVVYETYENNDTRYMVTFLGILLTKDSNKILELLTNYLENWKRLFIKSPLIKDVSRVDVSKALNITSKEDLKIIHELVCLANLWGGTASGGEDWRLGSPRDVDDFPNTEDFEVYLKNNAIKDYRKKEPLNPRSVLNYDVGFLGRTWLFIIKHKVMAIISTVIIGVVIKVLSSFVAKLIGF